MMIAAYRINSKYNFGDKPTVIILYAYINRHAGTPKQKQSAP